MANLSYFAAPGINPLKIRLRELKKGNVFRMLGYDYKVTAIRAGVMHYASGPHSDYYRNTIGANSMQWVEKIN